MSVCRARAYGFRANVARRLVLPFRAWLDGARMLLLLVLHMGASSAGAACCG